MKREATEFLTTFEATEIASDVADLMDDTDLTVSITYRDYQSSTRTLTTGVYTPTYTDYAIRCLQDALSAREVKAGEGLYEHGDLRFTFAQSDVSGVTPTREDQIVLGSETYEVVWWREDPISSMWEVVARKVK